MVSRATNWEVLMLKMATMVSSCSLLRLRIAMFICIAAIAASEAGAAVIVSRAHEIVPSLI
jgi:hypothetical protein